MRSGISGLDAGAAFNYYNWQFKGMAPGTVYHDPVGYQTNNKVDLKPQLKARHFAELKALSTTSGGVGTAGQAMVPVALDPLHVDQERRETPMIDLTAKVTNIGITADRNERTARTRGVGLAEDASLADNTNTYDRYSLNIKYYYAVGRTTGPAQASIPSGTFGEYTTAQYGSARQLEVAAQTSNLLQGMEIDMMNGNPGGTYTAGGATNTDTGYDAESVYSTAVAGIKNQISDENQTDQAGAAITIDAIDDMINLCWEDGGRPNLLLTDGRTATDIKALIKQQIREASAVDLAFGYQTIAIQGPRGVLPIIQSQFRRTTAGNGSGTIYGSKSIEALDMQMIENRMLLDATFDPLAKNNDSDKFMIKSYWAPVVRAVNTTDATSFHGSIIDIA